MSRTTTKLAILSMLAGICLAGGQATAANLNLCGGSPGGLWSLLGAGLDAAAKAANPDTTITYQTSSGGYANVKQVVDGKCELGIIHVGEGVQAIKGGAPFKAPVADFRVLMVLYDWAPMQWIMTKAFADQYGIKSLADLAEKKPPLRVVLNRRGILPSQLGELTLKAAGVSLDDIAAWGGKVEFQGSKNAAEIMQNGRADMWANATFVGSGSIRQIAAAVPVTLLEVPQASIDAAVKEFGAKPWTIDAGAYEWLDKPVPTHAARAVLIVKKDMPDAEAEALTKAVLNNTGKVQAVHKAMKGFTPELMANLAELPYHPGAAKAYSDAGVPK